MKKTLLLLAIAFLSLNTISIEESYRLKQCTPDNIVLALKELHIKYADVVFAQIMIESANLTSTLISTNNNLLGMRHPSKRTTTSIKAHKGYAFYDDWFSCLKDYSLYQQALLIKHKKMTRNQYISYLSNHYAKDPKYKQKLFSKARLYKNICSAL
jgi:hypothetical protein